MVMCTGVQEIYCDESAISALRLWVLRFSDVGSFILWLPGLQSMLPMLYTLQTARSLLCNVEWAHTTNDSIFSRMLSEVHHNYMKE